jgi:hypothetical protein
MGMSTISKALTYDEIRYIMYKKLKIKNRIEGIHEDVIFCETKENI